MKTEMYQFNGTLYRSCENVTLNFNVALNNLSKFLEIVGKRNKEINPKIMGFSGSSKSYQGKRITIKCHAYSMFNLMLKLGVGENSEVRDNVHVNYYHLSNIKNKPLPMVLIYSKTKGYHTQNRNYKVTYKSIFTKGSKGYKHIVPIN